MKSSARSFVTSMFGFELRGSSSVQAENRAIALVLKTQDAFVYRVSPV